MRLAAVVGASCLAHAEGALLFSRLDQEIRRESPILGSVVTEAARGKVGRRRSRDLARARQIFREFPSVSGCNTGCHAFAANPKQRDSGRMAWAAKACGLPTPSCGGQ